MPSNGWTRGAILLATVVACGDAFAPPAGRAACTARLRSLRASSPLTSGRRNGSSLWSAEAFMKGNCARLSRLAPSTSNARLGRRGGRAAAAGGASSAMSAASGDASSSPSVRPPYALSGLERPEWRGTMMGWLHKTNVWYYGVSFAYVALAARLLLRNYGGDWSKLLGPPLLYRALVAAATSANVFISDGYHNADRRASGAQDAWRRRGGDRLAAAYSEDAELAWLRLDYVGISAVLTTTYWLWAANLGWQTLPLKIFGVLSGAAMAGIATLAGAVVPAKAGHVGVKLTLATQFVGFLAYLVAIATFVAPPACSRAALVYACYAPGFVCYALKWPRNARFGFHELFHSSVLLGHAASMAFDLNNLARPCMRAAACGLAPLCG